MTRDTSLVDEVPSGGTTGQVLTKQSSADFDTDWVSGILSFLAFLAGVPANSAKVIAIPLPVPCSFPIGLTGSQGKLGTAATASTVFSIRKNNVEFGTCTFAIAGTVGTFASSAGASFVAGDVLSIIAPASADATAADVGFALMGTKS